MKTRNRYQEKKKGEMIGTPLITLTVSTKANVATGTLRTHMQLFDSILSSFFSHTLIKFDTKNVYVSFRDRL